MILPISPEVREHEPFDYASLDQAPRKLVEQRTNELKVLVRQAAKSLVEIGLKLIECKAELGHGKYGKWLKAEFGWGTTTAWKMMRVAEAFKYSQCENLNIATSALYLLAEPSTPEEARQEALERAARGETISHADAKEILSHHTIDVEAEVLDEKKEFSPPAQASPDPKPAPMTNYEVGDHIIILRRQHVSTEDKWVGKTARIWQVTPDKELRVNVEGHKGVRFTLNPDWVKPVTESPEKYQPQPEQSFSPGVDEPDPQSPAISYSTPEGSVAAQQAMEAQFRFQVGDSFGIVTPNEQESLLTGEVIEVLEASEKEIKVVIRIPQ